MSRNCYTCVHSPRWAGPGTRPGCDALVIDEDVDTDIIGYCLASGVTSEPEAGWPDPENKANCPRYSPRIDGTGPAGHMVQDVEGDMVCASCGATRFDAVRSDNSCGNCGEGTWIHGPPSGRVRYVTSDTQRQK